MKQIWLICVISFFTSHDDVSSQSLDQSGTCQMLIDCNEKISQKRLECDNLVDNQTTQQPPKNVSDFQKCQQQVKDKDNFIKMKEDAHRQQVIDCIRKRMTEVDSMDDKKKEHCQKVVEKFNGPADAINQTVPGMARVKRDTDTGKNATKKKDNHGNDVDRQKAMQAKLEAKAKAEQDKKDRESKNKQVQQCNKELDNLKQKCNSLNDCCSEKAICELMFEVSTLHDEERQAQLDIALKRKECKQLAPPPKQSNKTESPNTFTANLQKTSTGPSNMKQTSDSHGSQNDIAGNEGTTTVSSN